MPPTSWSAGSDATGSRARSTSRIRTRSPKTLNVHEATLKNLQRGLIKLQRLAFVQPHATGNPIEQILVRLTQGKTVVLEFGRYQDTTAYILVANILTRRIYDQYRERMEKATAADRDSEKPCPLVITIEEAHRFLNTELASQTIFGQIAREMRKYNVTLLVIDQRPSGIDYGGHVPDWAPRSPSSSTTSRTLTAFWRASPARAS